MIPVPTTRQATLLQAALDVARSQVGVREEPQYSNSGPEVDQYLMSVGLNSGNYWCMALVYWIFQQAARRLGMVNPLIRTGGCMDHWNRAAKPMLPKRITAAKARVNPELVKPGMIGILLIAPKTGAGHTYIVESRQGRKLTTIEGNSAENGSRNGDGCYRLDKRTLDDKTLVGFMDYSPIPKP